VTGDHLRLDVDDFERHRSRRSRSCGRGLPSQALDHYRAAVDLYRGDLCLDLEESDWLRIDRDLYRTQFVASATRAGQLLLASGDPTAASDIAHRERLGSGRGRAAARPRPGQHGSKAGSGGSGAGARFATSSDMITLRSGRDRRSALWAAVAPLVLVAVAGRHVQLRASSDLTAWKGGGFGMFSTVDSPGTRLVRVEVTSEWGRLSVAMPADLKDLAGEVRAAPSPARMSALAQALAGELWVAPRLPGANGAGSAEDAALDQFALEALATVAPVDVVRAVPPASFDPDTQQRVQVESVEVAVYRQTVEGDAAVRPEVIARVTAGAQR
jgi:hypothetical protein